MHASVKRLTIAACDLILRFPWAGWIGWLVFCAISLARTAPHRYGTTFGVYLGAAKRLLAHEQVYDPASLGGFLYLPVSLLVYAPFTSIGATLAAAFWQFVFAGVFTWGCYLLTVRLMPRGAGDLKPAWLAGLVLLINVPAAWYNFKGVQAQTIMTGTMLLSAVAIMRVQWLRASLWLFVALSFKPLAIVMALLCGALCPRMRLPLIAALVAVLALPFAFFGADYLIHQYRDLGLVLWHIASANPAGWPFRAELGSLLYAFGIIVPHTLWFVIRLAAALGTLWLAWRVRGTGVRSFAFALVTLSACYLNLFSPRNEYLSFLVLTPSLALLAFLTLARDQGDWRGWLLILAALVLGMFWRLAFDAVAKPVILVVIAGWLTWLMINPERWRDLVEPAGPDGAR